MSVSSPTKTSSRAPETSPRPTARPTSAPESSIRPQVRPAQARPDEAILSEESRDAPAQSRANALSRGLLQTFGDDTLSSGGVGERIATVAEHRVGGAFKPDEEARCADFVSDVVSSSGVTPDGFFPTVRARDFGEMDAQPVSYEDLQPGDVVAFNNTYRHSQNPNDHTHVGIYAGEGMMIHRPTNEADYLPGSAPGEIIRESIEQYLARDRSGSQQASFASGFRFSE